MPTKFEERVYALTKKIPKGKVATYGSIAKKLDSGARAVGNALNKNPYAPIVPCHRVVGHDGSLVGFAHGLKKKGEMLKNEGILVSDGKIDLKKFGFKF